MLQVGDICCNINTWNRGRFCHFSLSLSEGERLAIPCPRFCGIGDFTTPAYIPQKFNELIQSFFCSLQELVFFWQRCARVWSFRLEKTFLPWYKEFLMWYLGEGIWKTRMQRDMWIRGLTEISEESTNSKGSMIGPSCDICAKKMVSFCLGSENSGEVELIYDGLICLTEEI